jgi:hypothetical protein
MTFWNVWIFLLIFASIFTLKDGSECIEIDGEEVPFVSTFQLFIVSRGADGPPGENLSKCYFEKWMKIYWIRSLTPKILRPTWGNKAENIKAEKGGAKKKKKKKFFSNLTLTQALTYFKIFQPNLTDLN